VLGANFALGTEFVLNASHHHVAAGHFGGQHGRRLAGGVFTGLVQPQLEACRSEWRFCFAITACVARDGPFPLSRLEMLTGFAQGKVGIGAAWVFWPTFVVLC